MSLFLNANDSIVNPVDTGRKLNVHKTFKGSPGRLLKVLFMLKLSPVSTGKVNDFYYKRLFFVRQTLLSRCVEL